MSASNTSRRVAAHRAELRRRGLRPIQIWVPDTRAPGFAAEAQRQSALIAAEPDHNADMDFLERIAEIDQGDDAPR